MVAVSWWSEFDLENLVELTIYDLGFTKSLRLIADSLCFNRKVREVLRQARYENCIKRVLEEK